MINDAGKNKRVTDIEQCDFDCPFQRMRFLVSRGKRHKAGYVECCRKHECKGLRGRYCLRHRSSEKRSIGCGGFCVECCCKKRVVAHEYGVERTENSFLCKRTADKCHKRLPAHTEKARYGLDECSDTVKQAVIYIAVDAE